MILNGGCPSLTPRIEHETQGEDLATVTWDVGVAAQASKTSGHLRTWTGATENKKACSSWFCWTRTWKNMISKLLQPSCYHQSDGHWRPSHRVWEGNHHIELRFKIIKNNWVFFYVTLALNPGKPEARPNHYMSLKNAFVFLKPVWVAFSVSAS